MTQHSRPLKLPIGIQDFADIREEGYLYVVDILPSLKEGDSYCIQLDS
ncbi:MAG: hypothetical protein WBM66_01305 [Thiothrix litoralis]|jgi:hypothetical protein